MPLGPRAGHADQTDRTRLARGVRFLVARCSDHAAPCSCYERHSGDLGPLPDLRSACIPKNPALLPGGGLDRTPLYTVSKGFVLGDSATVVVEIPIDQRGDAGQ